LSVLRVLPDEELIEGLRSAASAWFNNEQLLMLEELIRRADTRRKSLDAFRAKFWESV
jgi:hypothetical protein